MGRGVFMMTNWNLNRGQELRVEARRVDRENAQQSSTVRHGTFK